MHVYTIVRIDRCLSYTGTAMTSCSIAVVVTAAAKRHVARGGLRATYATGRCLNSIIFNASRVFL